MDVLRTSSAESIQANEGIALEAIFGVRVEGSIGGVGERKREREEMF